jgi:hypothetical protein
MTIRLRLMRNAMATASWRAVLLPFVRETGLERCDSALVLVGFAGAFHRAAPAAALDTADNIAQPILMVHAQFEGSFQNCPAEPGGGPHM